MKKDRVELVAGLTRLFKNSNNNKEFNTIFFKELKGKIPTSKLHKIYDLKIQPKFLSIEELYLITKVFYEYFSIGELNPELWFTDLEKINAGELRIQDEANDNLLILKNMFEYPTGDQWIGYISYDEIYSGMNNGLFLYNHKTQREGKIEETLLGKQVVVPTIYDKTVDEIAKKILEGNFYANTISLNILKNGEEVFTYDKNERVLAIEVTNVSRADIIDGMHRILGIVKAKKSEPTLQGYMNLHVTYYDIVKAQNKIYQEQLGNKMSITAARKFNNDDKYTFIVKEINDYGTAATNNMYKKIASSKEELNEQKYCLFTTLITAIEDNFQDIRDIREARKIAHFLIDFFNEYIGIYRNEFDNLAETKKDLVLAEDNIFAGLVIIAKRLQGVHRWEEQLEGILQTIDWQKDNEVWKSLGVSKKLTDKTKQSIYDFFRSLT